MNEEEEFLLSKKEFIDRSMKGEVFVRVGTNVEYFYDEGFDNPFRIGDDFLLSCWDKLEDEYIDMEVQK